MSNYNAAGGGLQYRGTAAVAPPNCTFSTNNPTPYDRFGFSLNDFWLNTDSGSLFVLVSLKGNSSSRGTLATWVELATSISAGILTITGDDNVPVNPNNTGNLNLRTGGDALDITGDTTTNTISITAKTATTTQDGVTTLASSALTIAGSDATHSVTPVGLTAKLGAQTTHGVSYGAGTSTAIQWTAAGTDNTVLIGNTGLAPAFSATPSVSSITILDAPVNPNDGTNKAYVDTIGAGFTFIDSVELATTGTNLTSVYNNGAAGVGATLTNSGTQVAFALDGVSTSLNDRVLIKNQTAAEQNGIYSVTTVGSGATNWVLTRTTDYDTTAQIKPGNLVPVDQGTINADTTWMQTETVTTIGTDNIEFQLFSSISPTILPINRGGTNTNAMTNTFGVNYFDGTKINTTTVGTSGQVLTSNGAGLAPTFQPATGGSGSVTITEYSNPGAFVFTPQGSTHTIEVFGWGGGGGGGLGGSGGGGGGAMYYKAPRALFGSSVNVVVGAGGAGSTSASPQNGQPGGISSFGNWVTGGSEGSQPGGDGNASGGYVLTVAQEVVLDYSVRLDDRFFIPVNSGFSNGNALTIKNGSMLPGAGGTDSSTLPTPHTGAGGSIANAATSAVIIAGGTAGTLISPNGGIGSNGVGVGNGYLAGGAGGGAGYGAAGGSGGDGGQPGGGGGAGSPSGGRGGDGAVIVIEYS